jgi:hypothetical protein
MKKVLFAFLLGLTVVSSIIDLATPVSAQDEEPKPKKPEGEWSKEVDFGLQEGGFAPPSCFIRDANFEISIGRLADLKFRKLAAKILPLQFDSFHARARRPLTAPGHEFFKPIGWSFRQDFDWAIRTIHDPAG